MESKEKVYMVCDWHDGNCEMGALNIGVEHMGSCAGRILKENGDLIGNHFSSSFGWLRLDLMSKLDDESKYEIIDLLKSPVPERFILKATSI